MKFAYKFFLMTLVLSWVSAGAMVSNIKSTKPVSGNVPTSAAPSANPVSNAQVFVCTNKWCREKGSDATMATFSFLTDKDNVPVVPVNCLGRCNKGPNIRILTQDNAFIEASAVRSVESVVSLLQTHLGLDVNVTSAEVLRLNYEGNVFLKDGKVDQAIECYNNALALRDAEQEGVLLVMRGSALLQRAYRNRLRHKDIIALVDDIIPSSKDVEALFFAFAPLHQLPRTRALLYVLKRTAQIYSQPLDKSPRWVEMEKDGQSKWLLDTVEDQNGPVSTGDQLLNKATFTFALYEHSLMRALEDLLVSTMVQPGFAQSWRRAGDALGELQHFRSAIEYYEMAIRIDAGLAGALGPKVERLKVVEKIVANAEAQGMSQESVMSLIQDFE